MECLEHSLLDGTLLVTGKFYLFSSSVCAISADYCEKWVNSPAYATSFHPAYLSCWIDFSSWTRSEINSLMSWMSRNSVKTCSRFTLFMSVIYLLAGAHDNCTIYISYDLPRTRRRPGPWYLPEINSRYHFYLNQPGVEFSKFLVTIVNK